MLTFLVLGDWGRRGSSEQRAVADGMAEAARRYDASFVVTTGDNFYPDGVASIRDPHWVESFDDVYTDRALHVPWYAALGNHDHNGDVTAQVEYSRHDARWKMPDRYYAFNHRVDDRTHAQFIVLDTTPFVQAEMATRNGESVPMPAYDPELQQYWLQHMLAPSRSDWRIVIGHHPIRSGSDFHGDTPGLYNRLAPTLQKYGVQAYLSGHEHDLQHLSDDGLHYAISGAGGDVRDTSTSAFSHFSQSTLGFAVVTLHAARMDLRFCDADAATLYQTSIPCAPSAQREAA